MALNNENEKKTLLEMNASWPLLIVYLGYMVGIYFLTTGVLIDEQFPKWESDFGFVASVLILGLLVTFLVYNGFKILFNHLSGYRICRLKLFGLIWEKKNGKLKFRFDILSILDASLSFYPKDDDVTKSPHAGFLGGFVGELLLLLISFLLFFLVKTENAMTHVVVNGTLAAVLLGFLIPLYELVPFRQDYPNDMFNLIVTHKKEDQIAYNIVKINERRELDGEDFLLQEFDDYHSYYRSEILCYLYLSQLYQSKLEEAVKTLSQIKSLSVALPDDRKYFAAKENAYLCFLTGDVRKADQIFFEMKKDYRKQITSPTLLEDFRIALFVTKDKESMDNLFKDYKKVLADMKDSERVQKEKALFRQVYDGIKKTAPDQYLPPLSE